MAITVASVSSNSTWNTASTTITKPTGLTVGDLMVAVIAKNNDQYGIVAPVGWTLLYTDEPSHTDSTSFYKVADSGDVAGSNFIFTTTSHKLAGVVYRFSEASTNPNILTAVSRQTQSSTISVTPEVPTSVVIVYFIAGDNGGRTSSVTSTSITGSPTFTERIDSQDTSGLDVSFTVSDAVIASEAEITNMTVNLASPSLDDYYVRMLVIGGTVDGSTTTELLPVSPTFFEPTATSGVVTGAGFREVSPTFFDPTDNVVNKPVWTEETKPSAPVWTNQPK